MRRSIRTKSRRPRSGRAELGRVEAFSDGVLAIAITLVATMPVIILGWRHVAVALWILVPPAVRLLLGWRYRRPAPDPANRLGQPASPDLRRPSTAPSPNRTTLRGGGPGPRPLPGRVQPQNATKG